MMYVCLCGVTTAVACGLGYGHHGHLRTGSCKHLVWYQLFMLFHGFSAGFRLVSALLCLSSAAACIEYMTD